MDTLREYALQTYRSSASGKYREPQDTIATGRTTDDMMELKIVGALNEGVIQNRKQSMKNVE